MSALASRTCAERLHVAETLLVADMAAHLRNVCCISDVDYVASILRQRGYDADDVARLARSAMRNEALRRAAFLLTHSEAA